MASVVQAAGAVSFFSFYPDCWPERVWALGESDVMVATGAQEGFTQR